MKQKFKKTLWLVLESCITRPVSASAQSCYLFNISLLVDMLFWLKHFKRRFIVLLQTEKQL